MHIFGLFVVRLAAGAEFVRQNDKTGRRLDFSRLKDSLTQHFLRALHLLQRLLGLLLQLHDALLNRVKALGQGRAHVLQLDDALFDPGLPCVDQPEPLAESLEQALPVVVGEGEVVRQHVFEGLQPIFRVLTQDLAQQRLRLSILHRKKLRAVKNGEDLGFRV